MAKILLAGGGQIGHALAIILTQHGHNVTGLKRHPPTDTQGVKYFQADITSAIQLHELAHDFEVVFFILSPDGRGESQYKAIYQQGVDNLLAHFSQKKQQPCWFFVSSTSVYGQSQGEWVDENSPSCPNNRNSEWIAQAEVKIMSASVQNVVVRFAGIYGAGRESLLRLSQQSPLIQKTPPYFTNRIHQQDCVNVLLFLLNQRLMGKTLQQCYLACDDNPAPLWEVITWLAQQCKQSPPREKNAQAGQEMNKRCDNRRLKALGYRFIYPSYQAGYLPLLENYQH